MRHFNFRGRKMRQIKQNRKAFTMIELVFVIVMIGILSAVSIWYLPRTELKQAAETMINNLKYTKTLAQLDDRYFLMGDANQTDKTIINNQVAANADKKALWQFQFHASNNSGSDSGADNTYTIYAENATSGSTTNFDGKPMNGDMIAQDPMTKECISGFSGTDLRNCTDNYGFAREARFYDTYQTELESIQSDDCNGWRKSYTFAIYFDSKGLPYCKLNNKGKINPLTKSITIKLKRKSETAYICITKGGIIEGGNLVDKNGNEIKDKEGRNRGIPVDRNGKCYDI